MFLGRVKLLHKYFILDMISMGGALDNFHLLSRYICVCFLKFYAQVTTNSSRNFLNIFSIKNSLDFVLRFKATTTATTKREFPPPTTDAIGIYDRDHLTEQKLFSHMLKRYPLFINKLF